MKLVTTVVSAFLVLMTLVGCGLSKEQIGETAKTSMQQTFDTDPQFKEWHLSVTSILVLKQSENLYQGIAKVTHNGTSHDVPVEITVDGAHVLWKTQPGAFMFVAQEQLQKLQGLFQK